mmetsp:Transcript_1511/g.3930  ORF Transcript_1511/g.3930 Transcript_1511/m.3930 type:complete len:231 (-) Transcript_1511:518-1210(-)
MPTSSSSSDSSTAMSAASSSSSCSISAADRACRRSTFSRVNIRVSARMDAIWNTWASTSAISRRTSAAGLAGFFFFLAGPAKIFLGHWSRDTPLTLKRRSALCSSVPPHLRPRAVRADFSRSSPWACSSAADPTLDRSSSSGDTSGAGAAAAAAAAVSSRDQPGNFPASHAAAKSTFTFASDASTLANGADLCRKSTRYASSASMYLRYVAFFERTGISASWSNDDMYSV